MKFTREKPSSNVYTYQYPTNQRDREPAPKSFGDRVTDMDRQKKNRQDTPAGAKTSLPRPVSPAARERAFGISEYVKDYIAGRDPRGDRPTKPAPSKGSVTTFKSENKDISTSSKSKKK